ncbi:MAG: hypothetical protein U0361_21535 [Nitrospiraceae bacterium]
MMDAVDSLLHRIATLPDHEFSERVNGSLLARLQPFRQDRVFDHAHADVASDGVGGDGSKRDAVLGASFAIGTKKGVFEAALLARINICRRSTTRSPISTSP